MSALLIYGGCLAANVYWQVQYGIPVLPTKADLELFLLFLPVPRLRVFYYVPRLFLCDAQTVLENESVVSRHVVWSVSPVCRGFLGMGPFMSKVEYVSVVQSVKNKWQAVPVQASSNKPIDVTLVYSKRDCEKVCWPTLRQPDFGPEPVGAAAGH
ncbi:hypothetical protein [Brevibacillus agri]|uniref:hypothetical protein n=1 Tax=Brevibacillus agri TaxID=51101 RepID=UPI001F5D1137|nr:hypothetical protein [Brevibacillus agri]